ncbi:acyltransferase family protein [Roseibium algae]|uniref:Acyltransferase n=1 Tax=Roseibium algae TaxID=3123038 RepID=A0ABU8TQT6_9HYPH
MLIQLQYARAIAALLVVYFHAVLQAQNVFPNPVVSSAIFGETGVDLFFVLSGFVMWLTTANRKISPINFYKRRIERIVPLYWAFTLLTAAIALTVPSLLKSTVFDLPHLLASLFFLPWANPAVVNEVFVAPVIVPGWTLNYEMYFYLVFGVLLLLPVQRRIGALTAVLTIVFLLAQGAPAGSVISIFFGYSVIFEFLAGVILAHFYMRGRLLPKAMAIPVALIGFIVLITIDYLKLDLPRAIAGGIPSALVIYGLVSINFSNLRELRFAHLLGDASYSLYITHIYVLAGARVIFRHLPFDWLKNEALFMLFCVTASVVFALLVHWCFEKPVANFLRHRHKKAMN